MTTTNDGTQTNDRTQEQRPPLPVEKVTSLLALNTCFFIPCCIVPFVAPSNPVTVMALATLLESTSSEGNMQLVFQKKKKQAYLAPQEGKFSHKLSKSMQLRTGVLKY